MLHITSWYPSKQFPLRAKFVKEHYDALNLYCDNHLIHLDVFTGSALFKIHTEKLSDTETSYQIESIMPFWLVKEVIILCSLLLLCKKYRINNQYDLVNFHIAYPLLAHYHILKKFIKIPLVITEHWTAYQLNFNLPKDTKKLKRIKKIFSYCLPLISVSKTLVKEIQEFSGIKQVNYKVIPNVVDTNKFFYKSDALSDQPVFFALNNWRRIKDPMTLLKAFSKLQLTFPEARLVIGGYGEMWDEMRRFVRKNELSESIVFVGKLSPEEIAFEMNGKTAFLHSSNVETFSVVVAEALCCGTPVVVTKLPCIEEYFSEDSGFLVSDNREDKWLESLIMVIEKQGKFDRASIAQKYGNKFSKEIVGKLYFNYLKGLVGGNLK